jgi:hypothetical protein
MNAKRFCLTLVATCLALSVASQASAYYAAHMGRFTSRDPNGEIGRFGMEVPPDSGMAMGFVDRDQFDPMAQYDDGMNLYQYVGSSPAMFTDPSGLLTVAPPPPVLIPPAAAPVLCSPVGAAGAACVAGPIIGYKVGKCTTGPLSKLFFDWYYQPCPPCPPPYEISRRIDRVPPSRKHFPCPGDHEHVYIMKYNQDPATCECFPKKIEVVNCL